MSKVMIGTNYICTLPHSYNVIFVYYIYTKSSCVYYTHNIITYIHIKHHICSVMVSSNVMTLVCS